MGDYHIEGLVEWCDYWDAWRKWAGSKPSLKHPIKYIKWYFGEPKYRKENNK
jgi:hypothetical protein